MVTSAQAWTSLTDTQTKVYADARQYFEIYRDAARRAAEFPGWMFWKRYPNGKDYLVHAYDRTGKGTTLGGRSPENEARLEEFKAGQSEAKLRLKVAKDHLAEHARFCKAARINRVPRHAAAVIRAFAEKAPSAEFLVVGTHALYAYEALSAVHFLPAMMETQDLDVLWDSSERLIATVAGKTPEVAMPTTLDVLRTVDSMYTRNEERTSQARNAAGFSVDFLAAGEAAPTSSSERIKPLVVAGLDTLMVETISEIVIDQDGLPLEILVPDPRLFAAHKVWLSERRDRHPGKRDRDRSQSDAVASVLRIRKPALAPLPPLSANPDGERIAAILHDLNLGQ